MGKHEVIVIITLIIIYAIKTFHPGLVSKLNIKTQTPSEWRGFESRWFCRLGFEFANTQLLILNH